VRPHMPVAWWGGWGPGCQLAFFLREGSSKTPAGDVAGGSASTGPGPAAEHLELTCVGRAMGRDTRERERLDCTGNMGPRTDPACWPVYMHEARWPFVLSLSLHSF